MLKLLKVFPLSVAYLLAQGAAVPTPVPDLPGGVADQHAHQAMGPAVYSLRGVAKIPAALAIREADGRETTIASSTGEGDAFDPGRANDFETFAATPDGNAVVFLSFRATAAPVNPTMVVVPGAGILVTALGNAIGNSIASNMTGPQFQYVLLSISIWDKATGKSELMWDASDLHKMTSAWNSAPGVAGMGRRNLVSETQAARGEVQLFHLKDREFLLHASGILAKLDARARTLVPIWISREPRRGGEGIWQGNEGHLRFVFSDAVVMVEPDGSISIGEYAGLMRRVAFQGPYEFLTTDGNVVRRVALAKDHAEWIANLEVKNDLLITTSDPKHLLAYRHGSFGEDSLTKVGVDGKVIWKAKLGKCQQGVLVGESEGKYYVLVQRSNPDFAFRYTLNSGTGAILDQGAWVSSLHLGPLGEKRVPYVLGAREGLNSGTLMSARLTWLASGYTEKAPKVPLAWGPWSPDPTKPFISLDPLVGMWARVFPDLTVEPIQGRPLVSHLQRLGGTPQQFAVGIASLVSPVR